LIVTGGEPLLQQKQLERLFLEVDERCVASGLASHVIEIETNGTVKPLSSLLLRVDQWNVSPKLKNSGEPEASRLREPPLAAFYESGRAHFKFVVQTAEDAREVDEIVARFGWDADRVILMPEATDATVLRQRSPLVATLAMARRYRFSGRVHLELFGGRRGT
jgi:organic radical activating enzyme